MKTRLETKNGLHYATANGLTLVFPNLSTALYYIFLSGDFNND